VGIAPKIDPWRYLNCNFIDQSIINFEVRFAKTFFADGIRGRVKKPIALLRLSPDRLEKRLRFNQNRLSILHVAGVYEFLRKLNKRLQDGQPLVARGARQPVFYISNKRFDGVRFKRGHEKLWI